MSLQTNLHHILGSRRRENFQGSYQEENPARVGVSDRHLEKIRIIADAASTGKFPLEIWNKGSDSKMKVDKGYNQIKKFQRIKQAQSLASSSPESKSNIDLTNKTKKGEMTNVATKCKNITNNESVIS